MERAPTRKWIWALLPVLAATACERSAPDAAPAGGAPGSGAVLASEPRVFIEDQDGRKIPVTGGAAAGYVPDAECAACHASIAQSFAHHGMGKAFYPPSVDNVIEDFDNGHFHHEPSDRHYEMSIRDGAFFQKRYQLDDDGRPVNVIERKIDWVIGSGHNVRTYLYQLPTGALFQLPVSWYTQTQSWGMSPGYDRSWHQGFTRPITRACMFCHNGFPEVPAGSDDELDQEIFPAVLPHGIGCQRCHGPGEAHVRLGYDLESTRRDLQESIVSVGDLEPARQHDVCLQCHLQPSSEVTTRVPRPGRPRYSYRPGEPLEEYMVVVDFEDGGEDRGEHATEDGADRFDINHHPYRLGQSTCFIESQGAMSCLTCHDPHRKVPKPERAAHYRARCLTCHALDDCDVEAMALAAATDGTNLPPGGDCVSCHMPRRRTQDVIQVAATDHRIVRHVADPAILLAPLEERGRPDGLRLHGYWPDRGPQGDALSTFVGLSLASDGEPAADLLVPAGAALEDQPTAVLYFLADTHARAGRAAESAEALRIVLAREPDMAAAHRLMAQVVASTQDLPAALAHMERAVALEPESAKAHFGLGIVRYRLGDAAEGLAAFEEAVRLDPNNVGAVFNLGHAYLGAGRAAEAVEAYRAAVTIDPARPEASVHLGLALVGTGDVEAGLRTLRLGLRAGPTDPALAEAYAMALVLSGRSEEALDAADRARTLGADAANCLLVQALAEHALGRPEPAAEAWRQAQPLMAQRVSGATGDIRGHLRRRAAAVFGPGDS